MLCGLLALIFRKSDIYIYMPIQMVCNCFTCFYVPYRYHIGQAQLNSGFVLSFVCCHAAFSKPRKCLVHMNPQNDVHQDPLKLTFLLFSKRRGNVLPGPGPPPSGPDGSCAVAAAPVAGWHCWPIRHRAFSVDLTSPHPSPPHFPNLSHFSNSCVKSWCPFHEW